ncbi:MAG: tRNA (adenosine(37)-N6)-dimethylallyltransferase MiaA [bacterium]
MNKKVIVIGGPTASGKTEVSLELANLMSVEIISADSRQVFKYLDIGTAKPNKEELSAVKHHLIDFLEPDEYYSAGVFGDDAERIISEIYARNAIPLVVGGSGLYIDSLCFGLCEDDSNANDNRFGIREKLNQRLIDFGKDKLYEELMEVDPVSAQKYADRNPMRIIRALEYFEIHKTPLSTAHRTLTNRNIEPYFFDIAHEREKLYDRINYRSEIMWESGLVEETQRVLDMGFPPTLNSLNTVGYKECIAYLKGDMSKSTAIEEMKKNTRRYAKRQTTWFKRYENMVHLSGTPTEMAQKIIKCFTNK